MQSDHQHRRSDDSLDRSIRDALEVDTDPQRLARLERYWVQQTQRARRIRRTVPLAAAAVLAFAICVLVWNRPHARQPSQVALDPKPMPSATPATDPGLAVGSTHPPNATATGRAPTPYERFIFAARTRTQLPPVAPSWSATIDEAIEQLERDPNADPTRLVPTAGDRPGDPESLLLERLAESPSQDRAILRLLSVCGTSRSLPTLWRLSQREALRDESLATIQQIVGTERLAGIVTAAPNRHVRMALMRRLFEGESEPAVRGFLSLLHNDLTRPEALTVAEYSAHPPITSLMVFLDHDQQQLRLSAAIVLGHINGPTVTQSLIDRVLEEPAKSTEAWIALLACHGELAEQFFAFAKQRPQLLGYFNNARIRWARIRWAQLGN